MIDIKAIRNDPQAVKAAMARRGVGGSEIQAVIDVDTAWREATSAQEEVRSQVKIISKQVGEAMRSGGASKDLQEESRELGEKEKALAADVDRLDTERRNLLLHLPNIPSEQCPDGSGPQDNPVVRWWAPFDIGDDPRSDIESHFADHQRVPHWDIGTELGLLDTERGSKLSGAMFSVYRGAGASLVRALTSWAIDHHLEPSRAFGGFEEIRPPSVVKTETMVSTGALPKFADDAYHIERDDLWAIPTAEVPLTSMSRDEILAENELPMLMTAYTPCYRREAGSAGRDTRGLLRLHEFDKVEILAYSTPEQAEAVHAELLRRAEGLIQELGLAYRVIDLCTGDLGNSAARTFDLEIYAPGCGMWLEASSVSWFSDYQARRANIRYRPEASREGGTGAPQGQASSTNYVHTLNGSALAWPRTWAALVETHRRVDGGIAIPQCLQPYLRGRTEIT